MENERKIQHLSYYEPGVITHLRRPAVDVVLARARSDVVRSWERSIVTSTLSVTIQGERTVGHGAGPLSNERPLVSSVVHMRVLADVRSVLCWGLRDKIRGENLVFVVVERDVLRVVVGWSEPAVVFVGVLEAVLDNDNTRLADRALLSKAISLELLDGVQVQVGSERLVQQLNTHDDIVILGIAVLLLDRVQDIQGALNGVASGPIDLVASSSRVVEAVLRARCAVEVNHNLQSQRAGPIDGGIDERRGTLCVWGVGVVVCPEANGNAHGIETGVLDLLEVLPSCPGFPVLLQHLLVCFVGSQLLGQGELVHDAHRVGELLEDGRSNPGLKDQPAADVAALDLLIAPVEATGGAANDITALSRQNTYRQPNRRGRVLTEQRMPKMRKRRAR